MLNIAPAAAAPDATAASYRALSPLAAGDSARKPRQLAKTGARKTRTKARAQLRFPVVGIGASAGGLDALIRFFSQVPTDSPMGFVVVQHLDPNQKDELPAILRRHAALPVTEATDGAHVRRGHVYVIPPDTDLSIEHGDLRLVPPKGTICQRQPIDFFLRALAADQESNAVGVILSGMGSDGTQGLRAIKAAAGTTAAQAPDSAAFASMPQSVVTAGLADIVALPEDIPAQLGTQTARAPTPVAGRGEVPVSAEEQQTLDKIIGLLREHTGNDFSLYKPQTLIRRVEHRMALQQIGNVASYLSYLRDNTDELDRLFSELLIGVTRFFRDPEAWAALSNRALPLLLSESSDVRLLRAWVPACSTGEDAFSLAMVFHEYLQQAGLDARAYSLQIFATDLDASAIEQARTGLYPVDIADSIAPERLRSWFVARERGFSIRPELRDTVIFAKHNVLIDPPFSSIDLLICRNLLIYLTPEQQRRLLLVFHGALNYHGVLMLGSAESVGTLEHLYAPIDKPARLYRRLEVANGAGTARKPAPDAGSPPLQYTYEELQSANEELQVANAELTAARQELQSANEELRLLNGELQARTAALAVTCGEFDSLLDCADAAIVVLDAQLRIRHFGTRARDIFRLRSTDIGRPLPDIVCELDYPQLAADAGKAVSTLVAANTCAFGRNGRCYNIRIVPYRHAMNMVDGVIFMGLDITELHARRTADERVAGMAQAALDAADAASAASSRVLLGEILDVLKAASRNDSASPPGAQAAVP